MDMMLSRITRAQEERMRVENRRREYEREENRRLVARERLMRSNVAAEERVENKRFVRRLQQEKAEREMEERIIESERERVLKQKQAEQEEKLANVLLFSDIQKKHFSVCVFVCVCVGNATAEVGAAERRENETANKRKQVQMHTPQRATEFRALA